MIYQNKGVVGTEKMIRCSVVNILELILASLEMMRLICPQDRWVFFCAKDIEMSEGEAGIGQSD